MKDLFLRFCRWALPLFGVSAAISCDNVFQTPDMYGCPPAPEYGVPVMEFRVSGKVTDSETGDPVKGIAVSCAEDWMDPEVVTSETGEFIYESQGFPSEQILLEFTDSNGSDDGYYFTEKLTVTLEKVKDGSGNWNEGLFIAEDVFVRMDQETSIAEYGVPIATFSVKGRVVDSEMNPIPNIEVTRENRYGSARTDENGLFHYIGDEMGFPEEFKSIEMTFADTDGEENGGEFETKVVEVALEQTDSGDGAWNTGECSAEDIEIVLEKKVADE